MGRFVLILAALSGSIFPAGKTGADLVTWDDSVYIRTGFSLTWVDKNPLAAEQTMAGWRRISLSEIRAGGLRLIDYLPKKNRDAQSLYRQPVRQLTALFTIHYNYQLPEQSPPGELRTPTHRLRFKQIGQGFEVYIAGQKVLDEFHKPGPHLSPERNLNNVQIPLLERWLQPGPNTVAIRLGGDANNPVTGMSLRDPVALLDATEYDFFSIIVRLENATYLIFLYIAVFHFLLWWRQQQARFNLFFAASALATCAFLALTRPTPASFFDNTALLRRLEFSCLPLIAICFTYFLEGILKWRIAVVNRILVLLYGAIFAAALVTPQTYYPFLTYIWDICIFAGLGYTGFLLNRTWFKEYRVIRLQTAGQSYPAMRAIYRTYWHTISGNLNLGILVLVLSVVWDLSDVLYIRTGYRFYAYGFLSFTVGVSIVISNTMANLNNSLGEKVEQLEIATGELQRSEQKYRMLVDGTEDMVFSLDHDFRFITINRAMTGRLNLLPQDYTGRSFMDIVHTEADDLKKVARAVVYDKLDECRRTGRAMGFSVKLKTAEAGDYREFFMRIERVESSGATEFIARTSRYTSDGLLPHFHGERAAYAIDNYLSRVEEICRRLVARLEKYTDRPTVDMIRITLREMIINAIEHGNLNIDYDEKSRLQDDNQFMKLIRDRQSDPRYKDRKVRIEYSVNSQRVVYRITDEGDGFDHHAVRSRAKADTATKLMTHGRGIVMTEGVFTEVRYNGKGNSVRLIKYFREENADKNRLPGNGGPPSSS